MGKGLGVGVWGLGCRALRPRASDTGARSFEVLGRVRH